MTNEKWFKSSILTKVSTGTVLLTSILLLIGGITVQSWFKTLASLAQSTGTSVNVSGPNPFFIAYLIMFLIEFLIAFGIFRVINFARILAIFQGISCLLLAILTYSGIRYVLSYARETAVSAVGENIVSTAETVSASAAGILAGIMPSLIAMIPASVFAKIGFYLFVFVAPLYLPVLTMLLLFFCGKDFKKVKK